MMVMRMCHAWTEEGIGTRRRTIAEPTCTTERENSSFRQLYEIVLLKCVKSQWSREEGRPVTMRTLYRLIGAFQVFHIVHN